jgi:hypothetical protein
MDGIRQSGSLALIGPRSAYENAGSSIDARGATACSADAMRIVPTSTSFPFGPTRRLVSEPSNNQHEVNQMRKSKTNSSQPSKTMKKPKSDRRRRTASLGRSNNSQQPDGAVGATLPDNRTPLQQFLASDDFVEAYLRVNCYASAARVWERILTPAQQAKLGNDLRAAYEKYRGTVGLWVELTHVSPSRAVADLGHALNFLDPTGYSWFLRELGEASPRPESETVPVWDRANGKLWYNDILERRVRIMDTATNIEVVLNAFEAATWSRSISNPLTGDSQELHDTLRSFNGLTRRLKFHSSERARMISWETQ